MIADGVAAAGNTDDDLSYQEEPIGDPSESYESSDRTLIGAPGPLGWAAALPASIPVDLLTSMLLPAGAAGNRQPTYDEILDTIISDGTAFKNSLNVDWTFLGEREGALKTDGYVPNIGKGKTLRKDPNSGVTISTGFDIAQHYVREFVSMGLPSALVQKLKPYAAYIGTDGKKHTITGNAAQALLDKNGGLHISLKEAQALEAASFKYTIKPIVSRFNALSKTPFTSLPRQAQTVLIDIAYQYGPGFPSKNIRKTQPVLAKGLTGFLASVGAGDWRGAYSQLNAVRNASPKAFQGRRGLELDLMKQLLPPQGK